MLPYHRLAFFSFLASVLADDSTQLWHERYHGLLSMASYASDFDTQCRQTFTAASLAKSFPASTEEPWTLLEQWGPTASGTSGFAVTIPEMDKVVLVFGGYYGWPSWHATPVSIGDTFNLGCANCTAHAGAVAAYLEAKEITNDFELAKYAVNQTGHQFSVTGHGAGGMLSLIASIDLGWRGLVHWSHNHGTPRVFNKASADMYAKLFQGEAGQRTVSNGDSVPTLIPESSDYTFTQSGFYIWGTNTTYGVNYLNCGYDNSGDPNCVGGSNFTDHAFYYTEIGTCGQGNTTKDNTTQNSADLASLSSAFYATATISPPADGGYLTVSLPIPSSTSVSTTTAASAGATSTETTTSAASPSGSNDNSLGSGAASTAAMASSLFTVLLFSSLCLF